MKSPHQLLVTLLLGNALAAEALPIFLDSILPSWVSILVAVTAILVFAEVPLTPLCFPVTSGRNVQWCQTAVIVVDIFYLFAGSRCVWIVAQCRRWLLAYIAFLGTKTEMNVLLFETLIIDSFIPFSTLISCCVMSFMAAICQATSEWLQILTTCQSPSIFATTDPTASCLHTVWSHHRSSRSSICSRFDHTLLPSHLSSGQGEPSTQEFRLESTRGSHCCCIGGCCGIWELLELSFCSSDSVLTAY